MVAEFRALLAEPAILIVIATIGLFGYIIHYRLVKKSFTDLALTSGLVISLAYTAVLGGLRVLLLGLDKRICADTGVEATYFFVAGVATIWLAIQEIGGRHKDIKP